MSGLGFARLKLLIFTATEFYKLVRKQAKREKHYHQAPK